MMINIAWVVIAGIIGFFFGFCITPKTEAEFDFSNAIKIKDPYSRRLKIKEDFHEIERNFNEAVHDLSRQIVANKIIDLEQKTRKLQYLEKFLNIEFIEGKTEIKQVDPTYRKITKAK